jgi:predicted glycosyltransferase
MRILIDINHPAHVHLFKHFAWEMQKKGNEVFFTTREKEVTVELLSRYGFHYTSFGKHYKSVTGKLWGLLKFDWRLFFISLRFKPDLFLTMGGIYASHVAFLLRKPHIALDDTEHAQSHHVMYVPFTTVLLNPTCFHKDFGKKQLFYRGYHELAYLHPNRFQPDQGILSMLGLHENEKFVFVRFVSWDASHDIGQAGIPLKSKIEMVETLSKYARVFISSEGSMLPEFEKYRLKTPPEMVHHILAHASLFIGEGSTMASESACLGTPAIYINSLEVGYCTEQEKFGLVYNFRQVDGAIAKAEELLQDASLLQKSQECRERMLQEKIDVSAFLLWFVENYPESVSIMKNDPDYDRRFITGLG